MKLLSHTLHVEAFYLVIFDHTSYKILHSTTPNKEAALHKVSTSPSLYNLQHGHLIKATSLPDVFFNISTIFYKYIKDLSGFIKHIYKKYSQKLAVRMQEKNAPYREYVDFDFKAEYWSEFWDINKDDILCVYTNKNSYKNIEKLKKISPKFIRAEDKFYNVSYCIVVRYLNINSPEIDKKQFPVLFKSI